jgi:hypothetical protein
VLKALAKPLAKFGLLNDKIAENVELFWQKWLKFI